MVSNASGKELEVVDLELDDHVRVELCVVEEKVDEVALAADFERELPPHEGRSAAEFGQNFLHLRDPCVLELALAVSSAESERVANVGGLGELLSRVGLERRQRGDEVRNDCPLPFHDARFVLVHEHIAGPAVPGGAL
jgi:hypothetical protein